MTSSQPAEPPLRSDEVRYTRRKLVRGAVLVAVLIAVALFGAWFLQSTIPRHIVMASGAPDGMYHQYAQRYKAILARDGITIEERATEGSGENARLLLDPKSRVDVAFVQGGVVRPGEQGNLVMLASLYYEPLWIFYRGDATLTQLDDLRYKRVALGPPGTGAAAFTEPLLKANNLTGFNMRLVRLGNTASVRALQSGEVDAVLLVGPAESPAIWQALHDQSLKLLSLARADAYPRRFPFIDKLTLPAGTIDLALGVPQEDVQLIASEAMLVARDDLPAPIVNVLLDAAREVHSGQGFFEHRHEYPNTDHVDLPVSPDADRHQRFGPSFLHRYLPFFVATYVERLIIVLVPLLVILIPMLNLLPQFLRWRVRSRIYRSYGELTLLERDVRNRTGALPVERWLADLDRIEQGAARIRTPASYASEAYTLREHIRLVRAEVIAKANVASETHS